MKTLINTVKLRLFEDNNTGIYGLAHDNAIEVDNPFNAFWDGIGIFHDVFEHWFENVDENFKDQFAFNVGGEMAAMGACVYYYFTLGIYNRLIDNTYYSFIDQCRFTTENDIQESIESGYCRFGYTLESNIKKQSFVDCSDLELMIDEYIDQVKKFKVGKSCHHDEEKEYAINYKKSVTKRKIKDLHRWGFRMAENLIPDNNQNQEILINFIEFWNSFCKQNDAKELSNYFDMLTFEIYKDNDDIVSWEATFNSADTQYNRDYTITSNHTEYVPGIYDEMFLNEIILD